MEHVFKKKHVFKGLTRVLVKHVFTGLTRVLVGLLNMCLSAVTRVLELKHVFKGLIRVLELIRVLWSKHAYWAAKSA